MNLLEQYKAIGKDCGSCDIKTAKLCGTCGWLCPKCEGKQEAFALCCQSILAEDDKDANESCNCMNIRLRKQAKAVVEAAKKEGVL